MAADGETDALEQLFDGDSLFALRATVAAHGSQAGLSEGRTRDLVLVVHELAANAVRHGAGHGRLRLWTTPDAVHCEVTDDAAGSPAADGAPSAALAADGLAADGLAAIALAADGLAAEGPLGEGLSGEGLPGEGVAAAGPGDGSAAGTMASGPAALWRVEAGHGLWLVRRVADEASVQSGPSGTVAAVSFRLDGRGGPASFDLAQRTEGGCTILAVTGQLDLGSVAKFGGMVDALIAGAPGLRLVLDLTQLTGWDSAGLAALITAQQRVSHDHAARMILAGLPGPLAQRLCEVALDHQFTLVDSTAAAVETLG